MNATGGHADKKLAEVKRTSASFFFRDIYCNVICSLVQRTPVIIGKIQLAC